MMLNVVHDGILLIVGSSAGILFCIVFDRRT